MKDLRILLVAAALASFASSRSLASEIKIIANSSVKSDSISADDLKRIYLEERSSLRDGTHVEPVLEKDGSVHQAFLKKFLGKTDDDLQTLYRSMVFTGRGSMPKELGSDGDMVAYVAKTRGAIGYVSFENSAEGVKTLAIEEGGVSGERKLITRIAPEYPATLKQRNIGGTVRLQLTIAPKGNVEAVVVLGGNPILGEAATSAAKDWIYTPNHSRTTLEVKIPFDPSR